MIYTTMTCTILIYDITTLPNLDHSSLRNDSLTTRFCLNFSDRFSVSNVHCSVEYGKFITKM